MKFVNAVTTSPLAYVESLVVNLDNNEVSMVQTALRAYAGTNTYYYTSYENLANDFDRYIAEGAYAEQLDKMMNSGFFDEYLRNGKVIAVVKHLRYATDCGLAAAKHATDRRKEALNI